MPGRLLTLAEVSEQLDLTIRQVQRLIRDGKLPHHKPTGRTGEVKVAPDDLAAFISSVRVPARTGPLAEQAGR
jgi:excisionase family DNA binding protein